TQATPTASWTWRALATSREKPVHECSNRKPLPLKRRLAERFGGGSQYLQHIEHPREVVIPDPIIAAAASTQLLAQGGDEAVEPAPVEPGGREQGIEDDPG